jgi:hypothetical protein
VLPDSHVHYHADACCTSYASCPAATLAQQQAYNLTHFAYASSDANQHTPATIALFIGCPRLIPPTPSIVDLTLARATIIALAVVGSLVVFCGAVGGSYYRHHRNKHMREMRILADENEQKVQTAEHEAHMAAKEQEQLRRYAVTAITQCATASARRNHTLRHQCMYDGWDGIAYSMLSHIM